MDNTQNMSYKAGQAKGQAQEKGSQVMDKASGAAQSAADSMQEAGQQAMAKAQGAADAVKDAGQRQQMTNSSSISLLGV
ncbi:stress-induced protein KIN2-like [Diospyros lotus]|uniref:stress-induced protein KIN2-like n=1 Tax=Diospyros lotus TaxID=55363 RepID=UPI00224F7C62|nr:stress-induced protein KIN2-like [Diospyros lotus]